MFAGFFAGLYLSLCCKALALINLTGNQSQCRAVSNIDFVLYLCNSCLCVSGHFYWPIGCRARGRPEKEKSLTESAQSSVAFHWVSTHSLEIKLGLEIPCGQSTTPSIGLRVTNSLARLSASSVTLWKQQRVADCNVSHPPPPLRFLKRRSTFLPLHSRSAQAFSARLAFGRVVYQKYTWQVSYLPLLSFCCSR